MSKRGGYPGGMGGGFGGMNINQLMKQARQMQADVEKSQQEIAEKEFEATSGGGAVYTKVSGNKEILTLTIKPEVIDPDDAEMLQDLVIACINDALSQVDKATAEKMGKFNIPGIM